ncbi:AAA family ATPase [Paenibacillus larvae]|uniref:AAA family ATPase n=1 Tax=Paenibacillus larvae TaxID=1464 RepID=UPI0001693C0D|nr:AAA family ATPase [Paenibacillus larvae]
MTTLPDIAITGKLRAGKDTVADYLMERYGYARYAFGDGVKDDFHRKNPAVPLHPKPRAAYQEHGQMMREKYGHDVWVVRTMSQIAARKDGRPIVITDVRQPNELIWVKSSGYVVIRVNATDGLRILRAVESRDHFHYADLMHETEKHIDGFTVDYEINNNGDLFDLYSQIDDIIVRARREHRNPRA